ncbi:MAG: cohesin domain-containing protein, partial [Bacillota bacterium]|nr:cohesin domain-containing protein [Bacillota bacterium]
MGVSSEQTNPGKDVSVNVSFNNLTNVSGIKTKLTYDASKLTLKKVELNSKLSANAVNTNIPGEIYFNGINADGISAPSFDAATLTFTVNKDIEASSLPLALPVNVALAEACDSDLQNGTLSASNGTITVNPTVLPVASN